MGEAAVVRALLDKSRLLCSAVLAQINVDSWTKEQIESGTEKLVELAVQAFTFDDIVI